MSLNARSYPVALAFLLVACGDTTDHVGTSKPAATARERSASSESTESIRDVRVLRLDPKTSIPYDDRDRTDEEYFHGFRILATAVPRDIDTRRTLDIILTNIRMGVWARDLVRDADYGVRLQTATGTEDLLICTHCEPPVIARPADVSETVLSAETAASLGRIMSSAFPIENGT